jgi:hypothetical protein
MIVNWNWLLKLINKSNKMAEIDLICDVSVGPTGFKLKNP